MLFNSYVFIFIFLPLSVLGYFALARFSNTLYSRLWLGLCSLFYYAYWDYRYLPLLLGSIVVNYGLGYLIGVRLRDESGRTLTSGKWVLFAGIVFNVGLLGYFKYAFFFAQNISALLGSQFFISQVVLPLAISFYTFQQIAFLVDSFRKESHEYNFVNYLLFITFFPHLLAGPIVHHKEMMPQFADDKNKKINFDNLNSGLFLFAIGLSKKVFVADTFMVWANAGYSNATGLNMVEAWLTVFSYGLQLYFDFSGYSDMALGVARMFNIFLPVNFNSPLKALSVDEFWQRWHITLSRFLRDYVYIPLGGNRISPLRTNLNLVGTFLIGGFWHGASWTYVSWGLVTGLAVALNRNWKQFGKPLPRPCAWLLAFGFFVTSIVFLRATSVEDAWNILKAMYGLKGFYMPGFAMAGFDLKVSFGASFDELHIRPEILAWLALGFGLISLKKNSMDMVADFRPTVSKLVLTVFLFMISVMNLNKVSEFLYYAF